MTSVLERAAHRGQCWGFVERQGGGTLMFISGSSSLCAQSPLEHFILHINIQIVLHSGNT